MADAAKSEFDFLDTIKKAEPLAILASLSLVFTVFAFDRQKDFGAIFGDSVVASFMFIVSFVAAMAITLPMVRSEKIYYLSAKFALYFSVGLGTLYLLFIAYELGKLAPQTFSLVGGGVTMFAGVVGAIAATKTKQKNMKDKNKLERALQAAYFILFLTFTASVVIVSSILLETGISGISIGDKQLFSTIAIISLISVGSLNALENAATVKENRRPKRGSPL